MWQANNKEQYELSLDVSDGLQYSIKCQYAENGVDMVVDRDVVNAMNACNVTAEFSTVRWPAPVINMQFQGSTRNITLVKGSYLDIVQTSKQYIEAYGHYYFIPSILAMETVGRREILSGKSEHILWKIDDIDEAGSIQGHIPLDTSHENLLEDLETSVAMCGKSIKDYDPEKYEQMDKSEAQARAIFESQTMALKVLTYASIDHFRPTPIKKSDKVTRKKLSNKGFKIKKDATALRVVYLPRVVREYSKKRGGSATNKRLQNGRVGHLRNLRSDYFVNKKGTAVLIPPVPDKNGRFPKVLYKVKKVGKAA